MKSLNKKWFKDDGLTPYEINNGHCNEWAETILEKLDGKIPVELWETPFGFSNTIHAFIRCNDLFYDAECLTGVKDHMELPIFAKLFNKTKKREPVWCIDCNKNCKVKQNRRDFSLELVKEYDKENGTNNALVPELVP